jgi:hypothetical protein
MLKPTKYDFQKVLLLSQNSLLIDHLILNFYGSFHVANISSVDIMNHARIMHQNKC